VWLAGLNLAALLPVPLFGLLDLVETALHFALAFFAGPLEYFEGNAVILGVV
jgi:hypothetical protein